MSTLTGRPVDELVEGYEGKMYGALKTELAEVVVDFVTPFRTRTQEYLDDPETLDSILAKGAERTPRGRRRDPGADVRQGGFPAREALSPNGSGHGTGRGATLTTGPSHHGITA